MNNLSHEGIRWKRIWKKGQVVFLHCVMTIGWMCLFLHGERVMGSECESPVARVVSLEGEAEVRRRMMENWEPLQPDASLCEADTIRVHRYSRVALRLHDRTLLRLDGGSVLRLRHMKEDRGTWLELLQGILHLFGYPREGVAIDTPFDTAAIEGTELVIRSGEEATTTWVMEGRVRVSNSRGSLYLRDGDGVISREGGAPRPYLRIRMAQVVQWAVHYPWLQDPGRVVEQARETVRPVLQRALTHYRQGNFAAAVAELDSVSPQDRGTEVTVLRAMLLLAVGRVEEARVELRRLPIEGEGTALALLSVIALVQNERGEALSLARRAVALNPRSPAAYMALSYAWQAHFSLEQALESAQQAAARDPADAMIQARLAELWLMLGDSGAAEAAARKAVALDPEGGRPLAVLGFVHLARWEITSARTLFQAAIRRNQGSPQPHLGLGIALIRENRLSHGRRALELAVLLDPMNALLRTYLGRAYQALGWEERARVQYRLAQQMDPRDPTPWLFDALLAQSRNQPLKALGKLRRSVELNDNRAIYRARPLLNRDWATRMAGLAPSYRDLGFWRSILRAGKVAWQRDPGGFAAQRLYAEGYRHLPVDVRAASDAALRAWQVQPRGQGILPLPSPGFSLPAPEGVAEPGYNEYTALFERTGGGVSFRGIHGGEQTDNWELAAGVLREEWSGSIGAYRYRSDGYRENQDADFGLGQAALDYRFSEVLTARLAVRGSELKTGDPIMRIDGHTDPDYRYHNRESTATAGLRFRPFGRTAWSLRLAALERKEWLEDKSHALVEQPFLTVRTDVAKASESETRAELVELQALFRGDWFAVIGGGAALEQEGTLDALTTSRVSINDGEPVVTRRRDQSPHYRDAKTESLYLYANRLAGEVLGWDAGLSWVRYSTPAAKSERWLPKLGLNWNFSRSGSVRLAVFHSMQQGFLAPLVMEPGEIAGFPQQKGWFHGVEARNAAIGIDYRVHPGLQTGVDVIARELEAVTGVDRYPFREQDEATVNLYLYWEASPYVALSLNAVFHRYERDRTRYRDPCRVEQFTVPVRLSWFPRARLGLYLEPFYLAQEIGLSGGKDTRRCFRENMEYEDLSVWLLNAGIGYRLPGQRGRLELMFNNVTDRRFDYQDDSFGIDTGAEMAAMQFSRFPVSPQRELFLRYSFRF